MLGRNSQSIHSERTALLKILAEEIAHSISCAYGLREIPVRQLLPTPPDVAHRRVSSSAFTDNAARDTPDPRTTMWYSLWDMPTEVLRCRKLGVASGTSQKME